MSTRSPEEQTEFGRELEPLITACFSIVLGAAADKGIELIWRGASPGAQEVFILDPARFERALGGLLSSAVELSASGDVELSVELVEPTQVDEPSLVLVAIETTAIPARGGASFRFSVPAELGPERGPRRHPGASAEDQAQRRVLIVEDHAGTRARMRAMIEAWGMHVQEAESGASALEQLTGLAPFDAVLIDSDLPDMDGALLGRTVRQLDGCADLTLVLLSVRGQALEALELEDVFVAAVAKPVAPGHLHRVLSSAPAFSRTARASADPEVEERLAHAHPLSILAAEDEAGDEGALRGHLQQLGYAPDMVEDGHTAVEMALVKRYDLIIMDTQMSGLDGLKAMRGISHALAKIGRPRMVALTAGAARERRAWLAAGADEALAKPVEQAQLRAALERCVALDAGRSHVQIEASAEALSILVAEDNLINQRVIGALLESLGHHATVVKNGSDALAAAANEDFDLVLMDCHMPVLDGYATTEQLRRDPTTRTLPIVALTALNRPSDRQRCLDAGMDGYLAKPIDRGQLAAEISRALRAHRTEPS